MQSKIKQISARFFIMLLSQIDDLWFHSWDFFFLMLGFTESETVSNGLFLIFLYQNSHETYIGDQHIAFKECLFPCIFILTNKVERWPKHPGIQNFLNFVCWLQYYWAVFCETHSLVLDKFKKKACWVDISDQTNMFSSNVSATLQHFFWINKVIRVSKNFRS